MWTLLSRWLGKQACSHWQSHRSVSGVFFCTAGKRGSLVWLCSLTCRVSCESWGEPSALPFACTGPPTSPFSPQSTAETCGTYMAKMRVLSGCPSRETRAPARRQAWLKSVPGQRKQRSVRPVCGSLFARTAGHGCFGPRGEVSTESYTLPPWGQRAGQPALLLPLVTFGQSSGTAQLSTFTPEDLTASSSAELTCNICGLTELYTACGRLIKSNGGNTEI